MKQNIVKLVTLMLATLLIVSMLFGCNTKDMVVNNLEDMTAGLNGNHQNDNNFIDYVNNTPDELDQETELQIKQSYLSFVIERYYDARWTIDDDVLILKYYGTYNECIPVLIAGAGLCYIQVL